MERLSHEFDCSVIMGMRDRLNMVFLEVTRPARSPIAVNTDAGSALPITATAIGLAYLVSAPLSERAELLEALRADHDGDWKLVRQRIEKAYASYHRHGYVLNERSWSRDVNAVATPLTYKGANNIYSFMCGGPSQTMNRRRLAEIGPRLVQTVAQIRAELQRTPIPRLPEDGPPHCQRPKP